MDAKPCPFCGCTDVRPDRVMRGSAFEPEQWTLDCLGENCEAIGPVGASKEEALMLWNRRVES